MIPSHSQGLNLASTPILLATSLARSISNPTISSFSSLNPIGAKVASNPTVKYPSFFTFSKELSAANKLIEVNTIITKTAINNFFIKISSRIIKSKLK